VRKSAITKLCTWGVIVMTALVIAPLTVTPSAEKIPTATDIVQQEGQFIFSDNSSVYVFKKDGTFNSCPLGMSGRTITGTWKADEPLFEIQGVWSWINGLSALDDRRKMILYVSPRGTFKTIDHLPCSTESMPIKVYDCYFLVEELSKIPKAPDSKSSGK
jgi:hypothetical protein